MSICKDTRLGNVPSWWLTPPADINMRVPDEIKKCVVFFGLPSVSDDGVISTKYHATGFFIAWPVKEGDTSKSTPGFLYLVTAKHVAEKLEGKDFVIRANTKDGKSILVNSPATSPLRWYLHPTDANADVAVFPWAAARDLDMDLKPISKRWFLKTEDLKPEGVGIGDEVCIVGLFKFHEGQSKNYPVLRMGNIAMLPEEKVATKLGPMDAYLIEARSTGGISGSPVFVSSPQFIQYWILLGVIHGHWDLPASEINDTAQEDVGTEASINTGIAVVTPIQKVWDILHRQELSDFREAVIKRESERNNPVLD